MLEQRIQQHFIDSADLKYQAAYSLAKPVEQAVAALLACVTSGGKVLACGNGAAAGAAQQYAALCVGRFERERPELGAIALVADSLGLAGIAGDNEWRDGFARRVRALGQAGDVLLAITALGACANVLRAVEAAHERDMSVVALTGAGGGAVGAALHETDVHISVPHERPARIHEVHLLLLHCLADGVDTQLLGDEDPTA